MTTTEAKCQCLHCNGSIAFPMDASGQTVDCPHCQSPTMLFIPKPVIRAVYDAPPPEPPSSGVATSTIACSYVLSVIMPFAGFFAGIWLMTKKRQGDGIVCIALSIICFIILLSLFA